jgi:hypothetical protein
MKKREQPPDPRAQSLFEDRTLFPPELQLSGNCTCGKTQDVDRDCPMHYPKKPKETPK